MFNNIFCEMNIKKVIKLGGAWGKWGNLPKFLISSIIEKNENYIEFDFTSGKIKGVG